MIHSSLGTPDTGWLDCEGFSLYGAGDQTLGFMLTK